MGSPEPEGTEGVGRGSPETEGTNGVSALLRATVMESSTTCRSSLACSVSSGPVAGVEVRAPVDGVSSGVVMLSRASKPSVSESLKGLYSATEPSEMI